MAIHSDVGYKEPELGSKQQPLRLPTPEDCLTIDGLLKFLAADNNAFPLVAYPASGTSDYQEFTARDLDMLADAAVAGYVQHGLQPADPWLEKAPVIAILAQPCFEYIVSIFALNRMGYTVLFLSTRLSSVAVVRLLEETTCSLVITTQRQTTQISGIQAEMYIQTLPLITAKEIRQVQAPKFNRVCDATKESNKIAWIIHSSGTTGIPKPVYISNYGVLANVSKNFNMRSFCASPLYHSHGLMFLLRCVYSRKPIYFCNWALAPTARNLSEAIYAAKPELVAAVPYILKLLAETEEGLSTLANAKMVLYAGSNCPQELGDLLVSRGVNIAGNYGSTEIGYVMNSFSRPEIDDKADWNYYRLEKSVTDHILMDEIAPGLFECVALESLPSRYTSNSNDPPNSFRTRDLFRRHPDPTKSDYWKYVSRLDDRITLMNGEKVLPVPMESTIRTNPLIKEAVMFGIGKTVPGILIFQSENGTTLSSEEYIEKVWPSIEAANEAAETFSHIPKDLVVVIPHGTEWPCTAKGTFIRGQVYNDFANQITRAYDQFENGQTSRLQLEVDEIETFLLNKFRNELRVDLPSVDTDLFAAGVDSLQTTRIWSIIKKELDLGGKQSSLSQNILFEKRTLRNLATHLYSLRIGNDTENHLSATDLMRELINRYSIFGKREKYVLLITGATGSLGSCLVAEAVRRPNVSKVWALVRAADSSEATLRVYSALSSRGLHLSEDERSKIIARPGDFSQESLGLGDDDRLEVLCSLTHVIHAAWAVNFNLGVQSFEEQHIRGIYNLIMTCSNVELPVPAEFYFCSSISVAGATPRPGVVPERVIDQLHHAQNMGYSQSKMVGEHIVRNAMQSAGIYARVLRIGQIVGDTGSGYWNEKEATPLMIRSAMTTGALPALDEIHSWLPADYCARAVVDITLSHRERLTTPAEDADPNLAYHIRNPRHFHWTKDFLPALRSTVLPDFEVVGVSEWLQRLKTSDQDPQTNPSIKLVDYWEKKYLQRDHHKLVTDASKTNGVTTIDAAYHQNGISTSNGEPLPTLVHERTSSIDDEDTGANLIIEMDRAIAATSALAQPPDLLKDNHIAKFVGVWLQLWGFAG